ncbi:MAG TPA: hypothetical protein VK934_04365, partial [Fimbriimonas sp.]|nr:hypothetical protein [Fimbriimonas sp.]
MTALQKRITSVITRYGEAFTVGASSSVGIFRPLPLEKAKTYLTDAEITAATLPMWLAYVPSSDPSTVSATVTWNS